MYVAEYNNSRVQVLDDSVHFIRTLGRPSGLHIMIVYETSGQFVTSFGRRGKIEGEFDSPQCITSCVDGFIYTCM